MFDLFRLQALPEENMFLSIMKFWKLKFFYGRQNNTPPPKYAHALVPKTWEYVSYARQKGLLHLGLIKDLEVGRLFWITRGPNLISWVLKIGEPFLAMGREDVTAGGGIEICKMSGFEDGGEGVAKEHA